MSLGEGKKRDVKLDEAPKLLGEQRTLTVISSLAEGSSAALEQAN